MGQEGRGDTELRRRGPLENEVTSLDSTGERVPFLHKCDDCGETHSYDEEGYIYPEEDDEEEMDEEGQEGSVISSRHQFPICRSPPKRIVLPSVWTRMPNTAFGIPLGLAGQAGMWKAAGSVIKRFDTESLNAIIWLCALVSYFVIIAAYSYKIIKRPSLVRAEYDSPSRIHFMNTPNLVLLTLVAGMPSSIFNRPLPDRFSSNESTFKATLFTIGLFTQVIISQFVYEKWIFSTTSNIVSAAQPQFLLSTVGWFMAASLAQDLGLDTVSGLPVAAFCLGVGLVFYFMAVVAIINRLHLSPRSKGSPVLTLLLAPPATGVLVLDKFNSVEAPFSTPAAVLLGWCLVVFLLLIKFGPKIAQMPPALGTYWAYVFPLAALASACLRNAFKINDVGTLVFSFFFLSVAALALIVVACRTMLHAYQCMFGDAMWGDPLMVMEMLKNEKRDRSAAAEGEQQQ